MVNLSGHVKEAATEAIGIAWKMVYSAPVAIALAGCGTPENAGPRDFAVQEKLYVETKNAQGFTYLTPKGARGGALYEDAQRPKDEAPTPQAPKPQAQPPEPDTSPEEDDLDPRYKAVADEILGNLENYQRELEETEQCLLKKARLGIEAYAFSRVREIRESTRASTGAARKGDSLYVQKAIENLNKLDGDFKSEADKIAQATIIDIGKLVEQDAKLSKEEKERIMEKTKKEVENAQRNLGIYTKELLEQAHKNLSGGKD